MRLLRRKTTPQEHIYSRDPALDASDPERLSRALKTFRDTGDRSELPLKNGEQPAIFRYVSLSQAGFYALGRASRGEMLSTAVRHALVGIDGVTGEDGRPLKLEFTDGPEKMLTDASMALIWDYYRAGLLTELGERVIAECNMDPTLGQG